jgi:hypothetical protein
MILTHAHPAYLYSGGLMMTSVYEHLGCLPLWVAPPDTDELARQGLDMWRRITPDKPFMGFATGRFFEVAGKLGYDPVEAGLDFSKMPPLTRDGVLPLMTAGSEAMAYLGSPCEELAGGHVCEDWCIVQALHPETGQPVPDGQWGRLVVTTVGRDNFLLRYDLEEAVKLDRSACPCGDAILDCSKPVIAGVNGTAAGGGVHLAMACALVVAAEDARFIEVFVRRGIAPDAGGAYLVTRLVGPQKAKELSAPASPPPRPRREAPTICSSATLCGRNADCRTWAAAGGSGQDGVMTARPSISPRSRRS